jgi:acetyl esterase
MTSRRTPPEVLVPLDPQLAAVLDLLATSGTPMSMVQSTPEQAREGFRAMTVGLRDPATLAPVASVTDRTIAGPAGDLAIRVYRPNDVVGPMPTVLFFHGGGFVIGDLDTQDDHARLICAEVEAVVVSVDYRLAPEHPFPAGFEDCLAATRWVGEHIGELGGDAARIAVSGDSAGGNLAAAVALAVQTTGPALAAQLLLYPGVDFREDDDLHPSRVENGEGLFLTAEDMRWFRAHYLADEASALHPRATLLLADDLAGAPPAVVGTGEYDPLRDEGEAYAKALEDAGVKVVLHRYDGLIHGFFGMGALSPACAAAAKDLCAELRNLLG